MIRIIIIILLGIVLVNIGFVGLSAILCKEGLEPIGLNMIYGLLCSALIQIVLYELAVMLALYEIGINPKMTTTHKLLWMLIVLLVLIGGLILYLIFGDKTAKENQAGTSSEV
ncbi:MAG: PLDc N-terminal domain-containing protein [Bacteroidetes bacterium]|nr:PLDc N-terminal domain-containing protein [Bacteroidota bacterium]